MRRFREMLALLLIVMTVTVGVSSAAPVKADGGKYVKDVFMAYGRTEADARAWLSANGWEPLAEGACDFNAGKDSLFDKPMAVVMGIKRTDKADEAITDMAVMNMKGGYSLPDYQSLLEDKTAEIDEFIATFMPVISEYRSNYNGKGSALGKARADIAHEILNRFYDGDPEDRYAVNDTGEKLGDLFLKPLRHEGNSSGGDLQQILLESSGASIILIEQMLAFGADDGQETWLERLKGLTGDNLIKNLAKYAPEAAGQNVAPSAAMAYLRQHFADPARTVAGQWSEIHEEMSWYEEYTNEHDLWIGDKESEEDYGARYDAYFEALKKSDPKRYDEEYERHVSDAILYDNLFEVPYKGAWGETLGDFFLPLDGTDYGQDADQFLVFAAALSPGQRAALEMVSLRSLLMMGVVNKESIDLAKPDMEETFGEELELSVYTGINRAIFRGGVALTSDARMIEKMGLGAAFDEVWDNTGIAAVSCYASAAAGALMLAAGYVMKVRGTYYFTCEKTIKLMTARVNYAEKMAAEAKQAIESGFDITTEYEEWTAEANAARKSLDEYTAPRYTKMGMAGRVMMGIGGALLVAAAIVKAVQLYKYYQRTFTPIPRMIVDEADIVTYMTDSAGKPILDESGNQKKKIDFDQFLYYEAVKCNRPEVGEISDWQDGVKEYQEFGCYDIADLNGDFGQEWLALYTVRSLKKGNPILADSLTLQYGSSELPAGCTEKLHFFCYTNAVDLGDMAYSYNNDKNGVYFFWNSEAVMSGNSTTASAFSGGQMALSGAAGLLIGIVGSMLFLPKKKKDTLEAAE
ncbi:MAG: hypothetical protein IJM26_00725 [Lachnospiraceae bacterium]|nr:hypothetical protein [Lachnospiraceae bacterium]